MPNSNPFINAATCILTFLYPSKITPRIINSSPMAGIIAIKENNNKLDPEDDNEFIKSTTLFGTSVMVKRLQNAVIGNKQKYIKIQYPMLDRFNFLNFNTSFMGQLKDFVLVITKIATGK